MPNALDICLENIDHPNLSAWREIQTLLEELQLNVYGTTEKLKRMFTDSDAFQLILLNVRAEGYSKDWAKAAVHTLTARLASRRHKHEFSNFEKFMDHCRKTVRYERVSVDTEQMGERTEAQLQEPEREW